MESRKNIVFIVNPISGVGKQRIIERVVDLELNTDLFNPSIVYTEYAGHAIKLAKEHAAKNNIVVAVGGDGSVNEVATGLLGTDCVMGIVPTGSGNGLARTLGIPLKIKKAVRSINRSSGYKIDVVKCEDRISLCASGFAFDADISHKFNTLKTRGFWSYVRLGFSSYFSYEPIDFKVNIDGIEHHLKNNLILSVANANQYGNDIYISPSASLFDGYLRLITIEKAPWYEIPFLIYCLRTNQLNKFKRFKEFKGKRLIIFNPKGIGHVDGEPIRTDEKVDLVILPRALNILIP